MTHGWSSLGLETYAHHCPVSTDFDAKARRVFDWKDQSQSICLAIYASETRTTHVLKTTSKFVKPFKKLVKVKAKAGTQPLDWRQSSDEEVVTHLHAIPDKKLPDSDTSEVKRQSGRDHAENTKEHFLIKDAIPGLHINGFTTRVNNVGDDSPGSLEQTLTTSSVWTESAPENGQELARVLTNAGELSKAKSTQDIDSGLTLMTQGGDLAEIVKSFSELFIEVDVSTKEDELLLQELEKVAFGEDAGRDPKDYKRRADVFGKSAVVFAARKKKGDKVGERLQILQKAVMEGDNGKTSADYRRRAHIFSKSAKVFAAQNKEH